MTNPLPVLPFLAKQPGRLGDLPNRPDGLHLITPTFVQHYELLSKL
jgi:hypothetical protein